LKKRAVTSMRPIETAMMMVKVMTAGTVTMMERTVTTERITRALF
jgi:hypothetical protein